MEYVTWAGLGAGAAGLVLGTVALVLALRANRRVDEVTPGVRGLAQRVRGKSAEEALAAIFSQLEATSRSMDRLEVRLTELDRALSRAIRRIGLVRFDATDEISGELSFALCLLDSRNNGLLISSIYTLEGCRVFVRGIIAGRAQRELMPEEAEALEQAVGEP